MKKKIIIIGKKSLLGHFINKNLNKKLTILHLNLKQFNDLSIKIIKKYDYVCNCSITPKYQKNKYKPSNDIDIQIADKIKRLKVKYIFLSSRKVYEPGRNIRENSKLKPIDNYSKNKIITEKKIIKIMKKNYLILRISNIVGKPIKNSNKISNNFIDNFIKYKKQKKIIKYNNYFKDFLSINQFTTILFHILKNKLTGIFNVSLGEKIYISEIIDWLNNHSSSKFKPINKFIDNDSFYLNNDKLLKNTKIRIKKKDLMNYCLNFKY